MVKLLIWFYTITANKRHNYKNWWFILKIRKLIWKAGINRWRWMRFVSFLNLLAWYKISDIIILYYYLPTRGLFEILLLKVNSFINIYHLHVHIHCHVHVICVSDIYYFDVLCKRCVISEWVSGSCLTPTSHLSNLLSLIYMLFIF